MGYWFGKGCTYQQCKFEGQYTDEHRYEEDRSQPVLIFCNHQHNPQDNEGNCFKKICPLPIKEIITNEYRYR
jgi:hypothetical protein